MILFDARSANLKLLMVATVATMALFWAVSDGRTDQLKPAVLLAQAGTPVRPPVVVGSAAKVPAGEPTVNIVLGGRNIAVPSSYFELGMRPDLLQEPNGVILRAFLPEFTPQPTVRPPLDGGFGDKVSFRLATRVGALTSLFTSLAADRIESEPFTDAHGLRTFRSVRRQRPQSDVESEVYFAQRDQVVTVLIVCEPRHRSPPCKHRFVADGLDFEVTYHMLYVSQWQKIQSGIIELVRSFGRR